MPTSRPCVMCFVFFSTPSTISMLSDGAQTQTHISTYLISFFAFFPVWRIPQSQLFQSCQYYFSFVALFGRMQVNGTSNSAVSIFNATCPSMGDSIHKYNFIHFIFPNRGGDVHQSISADVFYPYVLIACAHAHRVVACDFRITYDQRKIYNVFRIEHRDTIQHLQTRINVE